MYHLCTTATFPTIHHKRKILDIRLNIKDSRLVGVTRFELATTRPPDVYSNRAELHPVAVCFTGLPPFCGAKITIF